MAKAKHTEIETVVKVDAVQLTLSHEEARTLRDILVQVSGCPEHSRRKHADNIKEALESVGFFFRKLPDMNGNIDFTAYPKVQD
jgi:hypothetical protein